MRFEANETALVKIISAGDEGSLEEKLNMYLEDNPQLSLAQMDVKQVEYHARTGSVDTGFLCVLVMRKKS